MTYCIWALIKTLLLLEREVAVAQYATGILGRLKLDGAAELSNKKIPSGDFLINCRSNRESFCERKSEQDSRKTPTECVLWDKGRAGPKTKFSLKEKMRRRPCADEGLTTKRKYAIMIKER